MKDVLIIGGGIGGLTLALALEKKGIKARVFESAPEIHAIGVGVNLLPHSTQFMHELGLIEELAKVAVITKEAAFFNRFGQLVYNEPSGIYAGYDFPQFSIHRGDLQMVLLRAVEERLGREYIYTDHRCTGFTQTKNSVTASFCDSEGHALPDQTGQVLIACDGLHSVVRKQLHPHEGAPIYSGVNMWRGVTRWKPFLSEASMVRAGWLTPGKMVIYPIRNNIDNEGNQLINWVAEVTTPHYKKRDWNRSGQLSDFISIFEDWHFDWLDVPAMLRAADTILEFPMVDQDPLPWWTDKRVTLLGDAAHPMVPRGSNGAGQAILDAKSLATALSQEEDEELALKRYEQERLPATSGVVRMNRKNPPDAILREVYERSNDQPFKCIHDVISAQELRDIVDGYKVVAGYDLASLGSGSEPTPV